MSRGTLSLSRSTQAQHGALTGVTTGLDKSDPLVLLPKLKARARHARRSIIDGARTGPGPRGPEVGGLSTLLPLPRSPASPPFRAWRKRKEERRMILRQAGCERLSHAEQHREK